MKENANTNININEAEIEKFILNAIDFAESFFAKKRLIGRLEQARSSTRYMYKDIEFDTYVEISQDLSTLRDRLSLSLISEVDFENGLSEIIWRFGCERDKLNFQHPPVFK